MKKRLSEYPDGTIVRLAGVDENEDVVLSLNPPPHNHDADYAPFEHNHDAEYSALGHGHGGYMPISRAVAGYYVDWIGGQTLPCLVTLSPSEIDFTAGRFWTLLWRESDNYLFFGRLYSGTLLNIASHASLSYSLTTEVQAGRTYLVIPAGATGLNVSGAYYNGVVFGGIGI